MTITVTKGYNNPTGWTSGETVTPEKLNQAQTPAVSVSDIVNADIKSDAAIVLSKLATGALPSGITVASANILDGNVTLAKLVTAVQEALVPAGAVQAFAMNSAPSGWLAANGSAVSRTTYAALFSAIGTTYGAGDGSTTFALPDLRGIFVRGSDSQTISGNTYSGTFGAKQADQMQTITGSLRAFSANSDRSGAFTAGTNHGINNFAAGSLANDRTFDFSSANSSGARTGTETRPANIALLYCIKF